METRRDTFQAIADPTRREIIGLLAQKPLNLNTIANNFTITRQAISLHIKILEECGLVTINQRGRERHCEVQLGKLNEVAQWIDQYKQYWEGKLDSLENYLDQIQKKHSNDKSII